MFFEYLKAFYSFKPTEIFIFEKNNRIQFPRDMRRR